ncbi:MAG: hypothetical protein HY554_14825 [Elusimicrobia bacterium]|nr:hypothetical protein [Elusimicrobiota bacterium]
MPLSRRLRVAVAACAAGAFSAVPRLRAEELPFPPSAAVDRAIARATAELSAAPSPRYGSGGVNVAAVAVVFEQVEAVFWELRKDPDAFIETRDLCRDRMDSSLDPRAAFAARAALGESLKRRFPYGWEAYELDDKGSPGAKRLSSLESSAKALLARIEQVSAYCRHSDRRLAEQGVAAIAERESGRFSEGLDQAGLGRAFENAGMRPGAAPDPTPVLAGMGPTGVLAPRPGVLSGRRGLKTTAPPPPETFETLTAGVVFSGPDRIVEAGGGSIENPAKAVLAQALRHIYSIPEGRKLLRDVQATRSEVAAEKRREGAELPLLEREAEALERGIQALDRETAKPKAEPDPPPGALYAPRPGLPAGDAFEPGKRIERCPEGQAPVRTDVPKPGDRACRDAGDNPIIRVPTYDPYQPYRWVSRCEGDEKPVINNWPKPGDMDCPREAAAWKLKEKRGRLEERRAAAEGRADVKVLVEIAKPHSLTYGHAQPLAYQFFPAKGGERPHFGTKVNVTDETLRDGNPARALDKILMHELRHVADRRLFQTADESGLDWLLGEDRAFLCESHGLLEQEPAMRSEPRSAMVERMRAGEAAPLLHDASADRLNRLSRSHYLWHVAAPDIDDPARSLQARLFELYEHLSPLFVPKEVGPLRSLAISPEDRKDSLAVLDPSGDFTAAMEKAAVEPGRAGRRDRFIALASETAWSKRWLASLRAVGERWRSAEGAAWRGRLESAEDQYWSDVAVFLKRHRER